jgi:hypothetical protein
MEKRRIAGNSYKSEALWLAWLRIFCRENGRHGIDIIGDESRRPGAHFVEILALPCPRHDVGSTPH